MSCPDGALAAAVRSPQRLADHMTTSNNRLPFGSSPNVTSADAAFCGTGLERSKALAEDIKWFQVTYPEMQVPGVKQDGPGAAYAQLVTGLAKSDPQAFICHYYNFYFAHTAGGRMIGNKVRMCATPTS